MTEKETQANEDARVYELGYHIVPTVTEDALEDEVAKVRTEIEKNNGTFISEGTAESIDLAYPMQVSEEGKRTTYTTAYFGWIKFEMSAESAHALQEVIAENKNVLRFVLFKTVREDTRAQIEEAAAVLQEVETKGTIEKKVDSDLDKKGEEVSDEELDRSIDELTGDSEEENTAAEDAEKEEKQEEKSE